MALALPSNLLQRITWWFDHQGNAQQVSVALLETSTWDAQCEVTKLIGPFDEPLDEMKAALEQALAMHDRQMAGQAILELG